MQTSAMPSPTLAKQIRRREGPNISASTRSPAIIGHIRRSLLVGNVTASTLFASYPELASRIRGTLATA
jgi:hypothetical protein